MPGVTGQASQRQKLPGFCTHAQLQPRDLWAAGSPVPPPRPAPPQLSFSAPHSSTSCFASSLLAGGCSLLWKI